ncbi:hypothetical protein J5N97_019119 [Dioscorea zingiberensis]|uniref:Uncharacterized protein n=1 Tax=Dioscorea zingiberensis TaxID=325984 RepID=A0A9D5HCD8_9LILI|nr:hypothetical protein J5N97_019119 [Dioscorea zingiberensis]
MERLLAFSILSSAPAEIFSVGWTMTKKTSKGDEKKISDCREVPKKDHQNKKQGRPCLAPEFDGLYCFETLVSQ